MKSLIDFSLDQPRDQIEPIKCIHSKVTEYCVGSYGDHWNIELPGDQEEAFNVDINSDISIQTLRDQPSDLFLAALKNSGGKVSYIFTVSKKQKIPMWSGCASNKCKCFHLYKAKIREANQLNNEEPEFFWERRIEDTPAPRPNYSNMLDLSEHYRRYGYNVTPILYPIKRNASLQSKLVLRGQGQFDLPVSMVPSYEASYVCTKHQLNFDASNDQLVKTSANIVIYTQTADILQEISTFARQTSPHGSCKCLHQYDAHSELLWHLGRGRMVCYLFLHSAIH